ncbi:hypothetical protein BKA81DRAFT_345298 [Phyllosticta paracitricarpa]|uniref:BZIP domain-containing protein n=1 Tax=Phyllosticta paracitricarpa TaxID=2016321 RepID=A0ABR1NBN3_9PEZI
MATASLSAPVTDLYSSTPPSSEVPATIKMEDLQRSTSPSTAPPPDAPASMLTPPSSSTSSPGQQKQPKKRKSWGQVLPEPKTNLPPRKRAKTADEKEQRRIERVKRNRLAAHNSRERKREEMERLTGERDQYHNFAQDWASFAQRLQDQVAWYRTRCTEKLPEIPLPTSLKDWENNKPLQRYDSETPAPQQAPPPTSAPQRSDKPTSQPTSLPTMDPRTAAFSSPAVPTESFDSPFMSHREGSYASPESMEDYESPNNSSSLPPTPQNNPLDFGAVTEPGQTQHSAAMLCDLQCRPAPSSPSSSTTSQAIFTWLISYLTMVNLLYSTRRQHFSTSLDLATALFQTITSSKTLSWSTLDILPDSLTTLVRSLTNCTPTQAQRQMLLATGQASLRKPSFRVAGKVSGGSFSASPRERALPRLVRSTTRKMMATVVAASKRQRRFAITKDHGYQSQASSPLATTSHFCSEIRV